jgi:hypothetical protein
MGVVEKLARRIWFRIHSRHVGLTLPVEVVLRHRSLLPPLPPGYAMRQPPDAADLPAIAGLLNQEPGFGVWTPERVERELMTRLAGPRAGTIVLYGETPVGAGFVIDESRPGKRIGHGMYLWVAPEHRRRTPLAAIIVFTSCGHAVDAGYEQLLLFTDPHRLPALRLYLANGMRPLYRSLSCIWHWWWIRRRLAAEPKRV